MSAWGRDYHVEETHMEGKNVKVQVWGEVSHQVEMEKLRTI